MLITVVVRKFGDTYALRANTMFTQDEDLFMSEDPKELEKALGPLLMIAREMKYQTFVDVDTESEIFLPFIRECFGEDCAEVRVD